MTVVKHHTLEELQRLFRSAKDARLAKRLWIVWQARLGQTEPEITAAIGLSRRVVQSWVRRYNQGGLAGLEDRAGRGRKPLLSAAERQLVAERVEAGPRDGDVCSLRGVDLQKFIEERCGKLLSLSAVYDLLHQLGYEWLVPRPRHRQADPAASEAFKKKFPTSSHESPRNIPAKKWSCSFRTNAASVSKGR